MRPRVLISPARRDVLRGREQREVGNRTDSNSRNGTLGLARQGKGEPLMPVILRDLLLFSFLAVSVTGIVIAVASLLI